MSRLVPLTYKECSHVLEQLGYIVNNSKGRHRIFVNLTSGKEITVPDHKELKVGTLRSIIRETGLSVEEFLKLR